MSQISVGTMAGAFANPVIGTTIVMGTTFEWHQSQSLHHHGMHILSALTGGEGRTVTVFLCGLYIISLNGKFAGTQAE